MKTLKFLLFIFIVSLMSSCSTAQNQASSTGSASQAKATQAFSTAAVVGAQETWQDVKMPITLNISSPVNFSASGTLTMQRDKNIHLSLKMLGFEVAVFYITPDTVYALDKYHQYIVKEPVRNLIKGFSASVGNLQSLILGKAFFPGAAFGVDGGDALVLPTGDKDLPSSYVMTPNNQSAKAPNCSFVIDAKPSPRLLATIVAAPSNGPATTAQYSDFQTTSVAGEVPSTITVDAAGTEMGNISLSIDLRVARAKWNTGAASPWKIPSGYKPVSMADLMNAMRK